MSIQKEMSIQKKYETILSDSNESNVPATIEAFEALYNSKIDKTNTKYKMHCAHNLSLLYIKAGRIDLSIAMYDECKSYFEKYGTPQELFDLKTSGTVQLISTNKYSQAIVLLQSSMKVYTSPTLKHTLQYYSLMALCYKYLGFRTISFKYSQKMEELNINKEEIRQYLICKLDLIGHLVYSKKIDEAVEAYKNLWDETMLYKDLPKIKGTQLNLIFEFLGLIELYKIDPKEVRLMLNNFNELEASGFVLSDIHKIPIAFGYFYIEDYDKTNKYIELIEESFKSTVFPNEYKINITRLKSWMALAKNNKASYKNYMEELIDLFNIYPNENFEMNISLLKEFKQYYTNIEEYENALKISNQLLSLVEESTSKIFKNQLEEINFLLSNKNNEVKDTLVDYQVNGLYYLNFSNTSSKPADNLAKSNKDVDFLNRTQIIKSINKVKTKISSLTITEARVAALLINHLNTKEIAQILGVSIFAIKKHRVNIRKKMDLEENASLTSELVKMEE